MYLRSLGKELYNNGSTVIQSNEDDLQHLKKGLEKLMKKTN